MKNLRDWEERALHLNDLRDWPDPDDPDDEHDETGLSRRLWDAFIEIQDQAAYTSEYLGKLSFIIRSKLEKLSPPMSLEQFGLALLVDWRWFKKTATADWGLKKNGTKWTVDFTLMDKESRRRINEHAASLVRPRGKKSINK